MQFKIPQDVQRADHIIGPLTLKQLIICGIGGGIAYGLYVLLARKYFIEVWLVPVALISLATIAFAFVKIHHLSFTKYLLLLIARFALPQSRYWQKGAGDVFISEFNIKEEKKKKTETKQENRKNISDIEKLTKIIDSHGTQNN